MPYIVNMSFYEGDTLHEAGKAFEHKDKAYVEKLLADGNIAEGEAKADPPADVAETTAEQGAPATPAPLAGTSDSSSEGEPQAVSPVESPPTEAPQAPSPSPTPTPPQPSPAEIEATLAASEGNSDSSNGPEIS